MDKTIDFSSLKSAITADKIIDLARKHNDSETLNETLRRKGDIYERRNLNHYLLYICKYP